MVIICGKNCKFSAFSNTNHPTFICSNSTIETPGKYEICSKLTIKAPAKRQWRRSTLFRVDFEQISHIFVGWWGSDIYWRKQNMTFVNLNLIPSRHLPAQS